MYTARNSLVLAMCLTAGALLAPLSGFASGVLPTEPPPPNQEEPVPAPKLGVVWVAGHWEWDGKAYWWRRGAWRDARAGFHWVPDRWEQEGTQWNRVPGHWEH